MTRYTDGSYLKSNPTWHAQDSAWKLTHVQQALQRAAVGETHSVCDMGCGSGALIKAWAKQSPQTLFTGYDISPQALAICLQNCPANTVFVGGSKPPKGPFDLVLALDVLEHIDDEENWLRSIISCGEKIVLHIPLERSLYTWLRPGFIEEEKQLMGHVHFYTPKEVENIFKRNGLKILSWHYTNKYIEQPPELKTGISKLGMKIRRFLNWILPTRLAAITVGGYSVMCVVTRDTTNEAI